jgi:GTP pyrophosphokinase
VVATAAWARGQWYVGTDSGYVAVYNGVPGSLGPVSLSSVHERSQVTVDSLPDFEAMQVEATIATDSLAEAQQVVTRLGVVDDAQLQLPPTAPPPAPSRQGGVRVKGVGDLLIRFAKCCHPIPGDPIIGFITRGKGVTVHLKSCQTVMGEKETARLIEVEWERQVQQTYPISIRLEAYDRQGLLADISQIVADARVSIVAANVAVAPDRTANVRATLEVASVAQLARVMSKLEQLKDVISVSRDMQ